MNQYIDAIAETYAPSSDGNNDYAGKLKQIIAQNNLTQYDRGATVSGSVNGVSGVSDAVSVQNVGAFTRETSVVAKVVKALAIVVVVVFAAVFFFNAFSLNINPANVMKNQVKKAVE